jgi:hypothetical protein
MAGGNHFGALSTELHMKRPVGLGIALSVALVLLFVLVLVRVARLGRGAEHLDTEIHAMPVYRPRVVVDPRMPIIDSMLPLGRASVRRRAPPPRGWLR